MLAINPLIVFFPDYVSFLIYGLVTGGVLRFWRIAKRHLVFMILYFAPCVFWLVVMWAFMSVQPDERRLWFLVGLVLAFIKPFALLYALFGLLADLWSYARQAQRERHWQESQQQSNQQGYQGGGWSEADIRAEQARREAEAKAHRASQQGQSGFKSEPPPHDKINNKPKDPPKTPQSSHENRSYEQILGLPIGWSQEDLKNAYKRESQRTHPDRWIGKPDAIRQIINRLNAQICIENIPKNSIFPITTKFSLSDSTLMTACIDTITRIFARLKMNPDFSRGMNAYTHFRITSQSSESMIQVKTT
jgi:hypothetical protein